MYELRRARRTHDTQIGRHLDDKDHSGVRYLKMKERMKVDREKRASIVASRSQMLSAADLDKIKMELYKSSRSDQQKSQTGDHGGGFDFLAAGALNFCAIEEQRARERTKQHGHEVRLSVTHLRSDKLCLCLQPARGVV